MTATILLHNVQALPVFYYLAQLRDIPTHLFDLQDRAVELLTRGPHAWLPLQAAYCLDLVIGLPSAFTRLRDMDLAIKMRVVTSSHLQWRDHLAELSALLLHDSQRARPPCGPWFERSAARALERASQAAHDLLPRRAREDLVRHGQTGIYKQVRAARGRPHLEILLRERWEARWADRLTPLGSVVRRACRCIETLGPTLPPFLLHAVINTWLNGWCTEHRFQRQGRCHFCHGPTDALEHLSSCIVLKALFRHVFGVAHSSFAEFLGIGFDRDRFHLQVLGLHAAKATVEQRQLTLGPVHCSAAALFRAELQSTARKWPRTRLLVQRWSLPPAATV